MAGSLLVAALTALALQLASAIFVHETSSVLLYPDALLNHSDFGFAMAYRSAPTNSLVVSAPTVDLMGKVYTCELRNAGYQNEVECYENLFSLESPDDYSRSLNPDQHFYMGGSIAATSKYFFTCAPLLTANLTRTSGSMLPDAFGTCFMRKDVEVPERYQGTLERYISNPEKITNLKSFMGGTGWSTLLDEENNLLIIVKTSLDGDFTYTPMSNPLGVTKSLVLSRGSGRVAKYLHQYLNLGFGITAGKFFSNQTVYAFSMETHSMSGVISFLQYDSSKESLTILESRNDPYKLENREIGTMFGSVLAAADLNMDGKDELLVGAPALTSETMDTTEKCVECGAVHIYLGGDIKTIQDRNRLRTILGNKYYGRFGTAIAARDIDGDSIPELVISAPYEDDGLGAVYILSGYEMYRSFIRYQVYRRIQISDLKLTQRIQKESFRTLGFSLQFIDDSDHNGCSELAIGSPGNASALLLKCIQAINVTMTTELIGEQLVKESDNNFTVKVCAKVDVHEKIREDERIYDDEDLQYDIVGNISFTSSIIGEATYIPDPKFTFNIDCMNCSRSRKFCKNVTVLLKDNEPGDYTFQVDAALGTDHIMNSTEFNTTWVVTSPYSQLVRSIEIPRHCKGDDCIPKLSMDILWSSGKKYLLGSSNNETVSIRVKNDGNASYESCVWVRVDGAELTRVECAADNNGYACYLPKPLRRNTQHSINLVLNMTKPTNLQEELLVEAELFENCNQRNVLSDTKRMNITYGYITDGVFVNGITHHRNVTDKQILMSKYIYDDQEFVITNNGTITWKDINAIISMDKKTFVNTFTVLAMETGKCHEESSKDVISYVCVIDLMPNSTLKITTSTEIVGSEIKNNLYDGKINTTSLFKLFLRPSSDIKSVIVMSEVKLEKELSFGNNKLLIGLVAAILALILLAILTYVLYKNGFFKRKQKKRLHVLRESIKQHQSRRNTVASEAKEDNFAGLQMDVVEDSPFDNQVPENDSLQLVEQSEAKH